MIILFLGDVCGKPGRTAVAEALPDWRATYQPDLVIANAENSANGRGAAPKTLSELQHAGVDAFTMGDHAFDQSFAPLEQFPIVRPANFPGERPGVGTRIVEAATGQRLLLINLLGFAFMRHPGTDYFTAADDILGEHADQQYEAILVDFHAEATSEQTALAAHLDGRVSAVVGTHTHVPTADTRMLPGGTAAQSDVGMCGASESVIGITLAGAKAFLRSEMNQPTARPRQTAAANRPYTCDAVLIETSSQQQARTIRRLTTRKQ